jgi:hypothetical protein
MGPGPTLLYFVGGEARHGRSYTRSSRARSAWRAFKPEQAVPRTICNREVRIGPAFRFRKDSGAIRSETHGQEALDHGVDLVGDLDGVEMARQHRLGGHELWTELFEPVEIAGQVDQRHVGGNIGHGMRQASAAGSGSWSKAFLIAEKATCCGVLSQGGRMYSSKIALRRAGSS